MDDHSMKTYQDFERSTDRSAFVLDAIAEHRASRMYRTARSADRYDRQENETICSYVQMIYSLTGDHLRDFTAANARIASNFFRRLNTQRCMYSLGAGVSFVDPTGTDRTDVTGKDTTKIALGPRFDNDLMDWAYTALIHGLSFGFWDVDRLHVFPITEFVPLWDEETGALRAGIRFWRLEHDRPMSVVLYEEDGFTRYSTRDMTDQSMVEIHPKRSYRQEVQYTAAEPDEIVVGESNYTSLPIVPMWGSRLHQSTLVGMRQAIDAYDLIRSGFANDLTDCAEIYWIVENCGGMTDRELERFRDRIKLTHIASADTGDGSKVVPYVQEIPHAARKVFLDDIRSQIYEDFGALDVHTVAAGATNDHIDAAYQPLDENAADFERHVSEAVVQVLALQGIEDAPVFKRTRISNQAEQVAMVVQEAQWLDEETILRKLPNIYPEEVAKILKARDAEDLERMASFGSRPAGDEGAEDMGEGQE